ncbi:nitronate monooxygenase family protein [Streptomyces sp. GbtcB6]|uniref:NAD(P)H-dependent flavin oxidoreductase n=1 Tax=Streptomyces sp. GbtcB6 TaxID=2824751 RepID=UPI001C2F4037|nr:nitronate monooxygenase [Streptomyces sp. GbtcB6]
MVLHTRFTSLMECTAPIQQAGMGWVSGIDLAVAVANAGALGMVAFPLAPPPVLTQLLDQVTARTRGAVGLNVIVPFLDDPACLDIAAQRLRLVEFFWADPDPDLVARVHSGGALAAWQVGSLREAKAAQDAGCDLVVVQGTEAGGHLRGERALLPLPDEVLDAVDLPVVAAGGIATGRGVAAVLAAGAAAARLGTRFVATDEADAHPDYKRALVAATETEITDTFAVMWPDAPHRVIASCVERARATEAEFVGDIEFGGAEMRVPARSMVSPTSTTRGDIAAMALYAGQSVGAIGAVEPAGRVVAGLLTEAEKLLGEHPGPR